MLFLLAECILINIMKASWLFPLLLAFASTCHSSVSRPQAESLKDSDFPAPPQQEARWDANTNLVSPELISAAEMLFEERLADPRGCDYRDIGLHVGDVWRGDGGTVTTHGWVLPGPLNGNQTFAVCWNGLVYPVVSVGARANVQTDMESLVTSATTNASRMRGMLYGRAFPERKSVAQDSLLPIKACLLLRLGENDLAAKVWDACNASMENAHEQAQAKDPYLTLAGDWAWALFDRMICAHMRGDVPLALVSARELAAIQPKIEAEAARRGFPRPQTYGSGMQQHKQRPYLPFLIQLPQLLADLERRAHGPKEKSIIEIGVTNFPNQSDRIAALIEDLDLVSARQFGQPGRVEPQTDPIVRALIKEGNPAVEPLLKCWENDKRLTRSVGFGRDFFRDRHVLPVGSAAKAALQEILQTQFQSAAEARAFWNHYKGLSQEERWYRVLRDESVAQEQPVRVGSPGGPAHMEKMQVFGRGQWMEAARMIVQPVNLTGVPGSGFYRSNPTKLGENVKLRGEPLRSKRDPSVTELLVKQANLVAEQANLLDQFQGVDAIRAGTELAGIINKWEKPAAVVPARTLMRRAIALWPDWTTFIMSSGHYLARDIPQLTEIRVEGGDTDALEEYAAWIKTADEEKVDENAVEAFEPLWRNPTNPAVQSVSQWLFNDPASPWSKLPWRRSTFHDPLDSDLMKLPAFHRLLARELENQAPIGPMQWQTGIGVNISYNITGSSGSYHFEWPDRLGPTNGTKVEVRRCDWVAWKLSSSKQIPFFNPFAPVEKRDEAIKNAETDLLNSK